jgi:hypothetical protein
MYVMFNWIKHSFAYSYDQCGCVSPDQWLARSVIMPGSDKVIVANLCNLGDPCHSNATIRLSETWSVWDRFCSHCTQACSTANFIVTPSSAKAPSTAALLDTKHFIEQLNLTLPSNWSENWQTEVENNYVSLEVICQSTLVENYTQEASIAAVDVLSNVGGHTGLWIGISFLSIMEVVEMLYRLLRHELHVLIRRIQPRVNDSRSS